MSPVWAPRLDERLPSHDNSSVSKRLARSNARLRRPQEFEMYPVWGANFIFFGTFPGPFVDVSLRLQLCNWP